MSLATAYLDRVAGVDPSDLLAATVASEPLALPQPVFLTAAERTGLAADLRCLHDMLVSLPERLLGGDRLAMAQAVGMTELQAGVVARAAGNGPLTPLGRADLYRAADGFQLLEYNISSALGGF